MCQSGIGKGWNFKEGEWSKVELQYCKSIKVGEPASLCSLVHKERDGLHGKLFYFSSSRRDCLGE